QTQLADLAGVSLNYVSQLENGKPKTQLDKLLAVIDVLGLELTLTPGSSGFRTSEDMVEE
ncbi:MAG TPA: helix-turn-helix domain-containing protein, partial [Candidatus Rifleibacterium sp.]|nr:helix-turn-helix domain-containing protein [Candidatus Rifleibacterium sp.]